MNNNREKIAIIGGGFGGLVTAYFLEKKYNLPADITIFEATDRIGGKISTQKFNHPEVIYEAGTAELYDYSLTGPDPLRELVAELNLKTYPMQSQSTFLQDQFISSDADLGRIFGSKTLSTLTSFHQQARSLVSPLDYYNLGLEEKNNHSPLKDQTFDEFLRSIPDETVRQYINTIIHSDLATEAHHTNAKYGLENYLMNDPEYIRLYGIEGGIEKLPRTIAERLHAKISLRSPVRRIETLPNEKYRITFGNHNGQHEEEFDYVILALPSYWISQIKWEDQHLSNVIHHFVTSFHHPAHYLRVTILFERAFWREHIKDSYFMLDAFGGCCVYDESSRNQNTEAGVLGWLLGGEAALVMSNVPDEVLIQHALDSLPSLLQHGREMVIEGRVHRWLGAVSSLPGSASLKAEDFEYNPDPDNHSTLFVVGDYFIDSTLNGITDVADAVAESIAEIIAEEEEKDEENEQYGYADAIIL